MHEGVPSTANVMSSTSSSQTSPRALMGFNTGLVGNRRLRWCNIMCMKQAYIFMSRTYDGARGAVAFSGPLSSSDTHQPTQWRWTYSPWSSASPGHPQAWPPRWLAGPPLWSPGLPRRPSCSLSSLSLWPFASGCRRCLRCLCLDYYRQRS